MNRLVINEENIQNKIYTIRGTQVMLDRDFSKRVQSTRAELYGVKPIRLREQVKRNIKRFPDDFMFQLNEEEIEFMVSQNAIPSKQHLGGANPYVFTEQGVLMLSTVLKTEFAIKMSIRIIRAFVNMRRFLLSNASIFQRLDNIEYKLLKHDENFDKVFKAIESKNIKPIQGIFYDEQIYSNFEYLIFNDELKEVA